MFWINKLNLLGSELLELKKETFCNHSTTLNKIIFQYLDGLFENRIIDSTTHLNAKNLDISLDNFELSLLENSLFSKNEVELLEEYDNLRFKFNEFLGIENFISYDVNDISDIKSYSDVKNEKIRISQYLSVDENFIRDYFGIRNDFDFEKLTKDRGFIEQFCILRFEKILNDFIETLDIDSYSFKSSKVIKSEFNYGIHFLIEYPIEVLENCPDLSILADDGKFILNNLVEYFNKRIIS